MNEDKLTPKDEHVDPTLAGEGNATQWGAWNDWKIMCSVANCSKQESKTLLKEQIRWAFWYKLKEVFPNNFERIMASPKDWAHEFDSGIHDPDVKKYVRGFTEYAGLHPEEAEEHGKFFKDYLWLLCEKREYGTKLDFIKGKLIGTGGIINQVVEHFIRREHNDLYINWMRNKDNKTKDSPKTYISIQSLDQPLKEDQTTTLMDRISSDSSFTQPFEETNHKNRINFEARLSAFSWQEIAFLLAATTGKLTQEITMQFVGINSPAAISRFNKNKEFEKKRSTFQKYMREAGISLEEKKECINLMKKRLRVEKNSEAFLNMIEPEFKRIFKQINEYYDKKYKKEND